MTAREKLAAARLMVVTRTPYLNAAVFALLPRESGAVPTIGVTKAAVMLYNPTWVAAQFIDELAFALVHECLHILNDHHDRLRVFDETGRVGNVGCFPPSVIVDAGPIEAVVPGQFVINDHAVARVVNVAARLHDGKLITIRASSLLPLRTTPNHPILVARRKGASHYPIALRSPTWVRADEIAPGDYVYFARPPTDMNVVALDLSGFARVDADRPPVCKRMPLTAETAWLMGLWAAEGHAERGGAYLSLGSHEQALADRAIEIGRGLGFKLSSRCRERHRSIKVRIGGPILGRAFAIWCGRGAKNKRVPDFILRHKNAEIRRAFLVGLAIGDGWNHIPTAHRGIGTASRVLAIGIQRLLASLGTFGWASVVQQKVGREIHGKPLPAGVLYTVSWSDKPRTHRKQMRDIEIDSHSRRWRATEHGIAVPVLSVGCEPYSGLVYNFEAANSHVYTAEGIVVHNSDLAINPTCRAMGWPPPAGILWPAAFGWEEGLVAEEYCRRLKEQQAGQQGASQQGASRRESDRRASGASAPSDSQQQPGHGWCGSAGGRPVDGEPADGDASEGRSKADLERVARAVAEAARAQAARGCGDVPGEVLRWADEILRPPRIRWQDKLARAARASVGYRKGVGDYTYQYPSKKQAGVGYGPGRPILIAHRQPVPRVVVAVDTSGSMGAEELAVALSECAGVLRAVGSDIEFFACDAKATVPRKVARPSEFAKLLVGGGGTSFAPAFTIIERMRVRPDCLIYVTDGNGSTAPVSRAPEGVRTIWVLVGRCRRRPDFPDEPFGEVIEVGDAA